MDMVDRLRIAGIAIAIGLVAAPMAIVMTIAGLPLWSWVEAAFAIESVGHSGPAGWCYLTSYVLILACAGFIWWTIRRRANGKK
jgi:hypothetical protein